MNFSSWVSTHSRLKAAEVKRAEQKKKEKVSTHSRLKAAEPKPDDKPDPDGFNTQPPEGG